MHAQVVQPDGWLQYAIPAVIFLVVFGLRARRMTQLRPLKVEQLWIVPALYLVIVGALFVRTPPSLAGWGIALLGLLAGAGLGWQRGKTMRIHVDPATHALTQRGSVWAIVIILVLVGLKMLAQTEGSALHLDVNLLIDGLAALSLGMFAAQRLEMYLRARRLLADTRASAAI